MAILNMIMPEKLREITVKIIKAPYRIGDDVFCDVRIFGDLGRNTFRMKIGKTLWHSLYDELVMRFELGGDAGEEIDKNLECIVGKMITIKGIPDVNRAYINKQGKPDSPKIFVVMLREDIEEAERIGGDAYNNALDRVVIENKLCHDCYRTNMALVDEEERKEKEREEKRKKREDISKNLKKLDTVRVQGQKYPEVDKLWS